MADRADAGGGGTAEAEAGAGRRSRRKARTRAALLEAGRRLLAERGPAETTIAEITARADLGFGTFYLHFGSKDELVEAVVAEGVAELVAALDHGTAGLDDPVERHRAAVRAYLRFAHDHGDLVRVVLRTAPARADLEQRFHQPLRERIEAFLRTGEAAGEVPAGSVELRTAMILACLRWMGLWWKDHDEPDPERVADELIAFVESGIRQPETPATT